MSVGLSERAGGAEVSSACQDHGRLFFAILSLSLRVRAAIETREHFENAEVLYDWVGNTRGDKLRTFATRPRKLPAKCQSSFSWAG